MELKTLELHNFLALTEATLDLDNQGLVLLEGINLDADSFKSNGAAKSSLLEGITYALYGQVSSGLAGDHIVNNKIGKDTYVKLTFTILDTTYRIERYRKHKTNKNKVLLFINDEDNTQATIKATNALIQEIIGIDINTYLNSIIFGQGDIKKFSEATDKEKKQILEDIANVTIYKKAQDIAKEKRNTIQSQVTLLEQKVSSSNLLLSNLKQQAQQNEQLILAHEQRVTYYKDKVDTLEQQISNFVTLTWDTEQEQELERVKDNLANYSNYDSSQLLEYSTQYNQVLNKQQNLKNTINTATKTINETVNKMKVFKSSPLATCDFCGHELDAEHKQKEEQRLITIYQENNQELQAANNELNTLVDITVLQQQIATLKQEETTHTQHLKELQLEYQNLLKKQQEVVSSQMQLQQLKDQLEQNKEALNNAINAPKPITDFDSINTSEQELKGLEGQLEGLKQELETLAQVVNVYSNKGVKAHVMELITPFLTQQANTYLQELTGGTISVRLEINPENDSLELNVTNINGANDYTLNSKGEQKRIDLAIAMAMQDYVMSRSNIKPNFIGYDEVFDGLDSVGIDRIMTILKDRVKVIPSIFVISHNDNLKELFENTITVIKKDGLSHVKRSNN